MRPLSAAELLDLWERGLTESPVQRALTVLAAACPEMAWEELASLSIGQRDGRLLTVREWLFGSQIQSLATCPACGDRLELAFTVDDIRVATEPMGLGMGAWSVQIADYEVKFRLPNSLDLAAITAEPEAVGGQPERSLLSRCLVAASYQGESQSLEQLPPAVIDEVVQQMAQADAQADVQLDLSCPACGHQWQSAFDIVAFLWTEIDAWAERTLLEVHLLASAYGWREQDILAMSPFRRQLYLEMVQ